MIGAPMKTSELKPGQTVIILPSKVPWDTFKGKGIVLQVNETGDLVRVAIGRHEVWFVPKRIEGVES